MVRALLPLVCAYALAAASCSSSSGTASQSEPVLIGFPADLSSTFASYDVPMRDGAQFAIDEINAAGGVLGRAMKLLVVDQGNDVTATATVTRQLIGQGVAYLIGTTGNGAVTEGQLACQSAIPVSTGDGTAPTLVGEMGDCAFQLVMSDNVQAAVDAEYALQQGHATAYLLQSPGYEYTESLPTYFADAFEHGGGTIVGEDAYTIGAGDFSTVVTALAAASPPPDVIFTPMFPPDTQVFMQQLRQAGLTTPVISADGNFDPSLTDAGPQALDGLVFTASGCPPMPGTPLQSFYDRYTAATGAAPASIVTALGYDEIYALKSVIDAQQNAAPRSIINGLAALDYSGVTGEIAMDPQTRRADKAPWLIIMRGVDFTCGGNHYPNYVPPVP